MDNPERGRFCTECGANLPGGSFNGEPFSLQRLVAQCLLAILALVFGIVLGAAPPLALIFAINTDSPDRSTESVAMGIVLSVFALVLALSLILMVRFKVSVGWFLISATPAFFYAVLILAALANGWSE